MEQHHTQLVARALIGDDQAFALLVKTYLSPLYNFVFLIVREREATEDIVQETYIKAWKHLKRFDQRQNFKTWLYTIAKNTAFDHLKKKKLFLFPSLEDSDDNLPFERSLVHEPDILETLDQERAVRVLDQALEKLPTLYRTLLVLMYREDFNLREASFILGEPYNTVKSRHQRAIQKLKGVYEEQFASEKIPSAY